MATRSQATGALGKSTSAGEVAAADNAALAEAAKAKTLLTFDARAFGDDFLNEFQKTGIAVPTADTPASVRTKGPK